MTDQRVEAPVPATASVLVPDEVVHTVRLIERGPFVLAVCDCCDWETFARRSRPLARREGRDHEILHNA